MKNMNPADMKSQFEASAKMMSDRSSYMTSGAHQMKEKGNALVKQGDYRGAIDIYRQAINNLSGTSDDVLLESCKLNTSLCQLKLEDYEAVIATCDDVLATAQKPVVKALFRRGVACCNLPDRHREGYIQIKRANLLSPADATIQAECNKQGGLFDIDVEEADREAARLNEEAKDAPAKVVPASQSSSAGQAPSTSSSSAPTPSPELMKTMMQDGTAMKQMSRMMQDFSPEQLAGMTGQSVDQCKAMKETMNSMGGNEEMMNSVSKMMDSMSPEDMERMMQMQMAGRSGSTANGSVPSPQDFLKDPNMMKTAETMMRSLPPEQMREMMKAQGVEVSERQAKIATTVMPILIALFRYFLQMKALFFAYKHYLLAFVVLVVGLSYF